MSGVGRFTPSCCAAGFFHLLLLLLFHFFFLDARDLGLQHLDLRFDQLFLLLDLFGIGAGVLQLHQLLLQSLNLPVQRLMMRAEARLSLRFAGSSLPLSAFAFLRLAFRLVVDRFGHQQFALMARRAEDVADAGNGILIGADHGGCWSTWMLS